MIQNSFQYFVQRPIGTNHHYKQGEFWLGDFLRFYFVNYKEERNVKEIFAASMYCICIKFFLFYQNHGRKK